MMYFIDIETNLAHDTLWCVATTDEDGVSKLYTEGMYDQLPDVHTNVFVAHYGMGFDFPRLKALIGYDIPLENQFDTILLSKIVDCNTEGGHSLKNLASRYGKELKADFDVADFDLGFSQKMGDYCIQDTIALRSIYKGLMEKLNAMGSKGTEAYLDMEHKVRDLTYQQTANGFRLDVEKVSNLYSDLACHTSGIEASLREAFPPIVTERWSEKTGKQLKDNVETFNPASRQQIAKRLEGLGVKWSKYTDKGSIIVDETTLSKHSKIPEAAAVLDYLTTNKKQSQVNSWLKHVTPEGRVHGRVDTLGAVTGRMTHQQPNMAQIAKGEDTRGVWTVDKGMKLVGIDASGLELRMLAHYMQDGEYIEAVESGDVHAMNRDALGLSGSEGRDVAKTFIYAFLYGAGDAKIGSIMGGGAKQGKALKEAFLANTPALAKLRDKVSRISKRGYLPALDGRPLRVRSEHAALNVLLQGAGAIVMKRGLLIGDALLQGTPYMLVAQVHDELQCEVSDEHSHRVGHSFVEGIRGAGAYYDMRIKLDGEYSVGNTWHDTH